MNAKMVSSVAGIMITIVVVAFFVSEMFNITPSAGTTYTFENTLENAGTAYLTVDQHDEIKTGRLTGALQVSDNVTVTIEVNGTTVYSKTTGSENIDNNVLQYITDGQNSWQVTVDNVSRLTAPFITKLTVTTYQRSLGEKLQEQEENRFPTIFTLLILVAIIATIMLVLRTIGAI